MRLRGVAAIATVAALCCCLQAPSPARQTDDAAGADAARRDVATLAITNVTLIDVERGERIPATTIVVDGNRIVAVGPPDATSRYRTSEFVDGSGAFAIPGLWDMHVHTGPQEVFFPLYVAHGITGVRDAGGDLPRATGNASVRLETLLEWRQRVEAGTMLGPRMLVTGPIIDGPEPYWPGVTTPVASPDAARALVRSLKARGAEFIKVYELLPRETYLAITDESKKVALPFAGHVPKAFSVDEVSNAGQRCIEHLDDIIECRTMPPAELFDVFKKNGTWHVPALAVKRYLVDGETAFQDDPRLEYVPAYIREIWKGSWWHKESDPRARAWCRSRYHMLSRLVAHMHLAGVNIMAGSDSANPYTYPGFSLHDELARLASAGLSPVDVLRTATTKPAEFLGRAHELGTIAPGKLADIVLLEADPLEDARNTAQIRAVVVGGRYQDRAALDAMLAAAARAAADMK